ncbi:hypothetical protein [Mesobacillus jeotgali]|uniref:hypothetical protein n=1 Tax=Mesobacillus jeotgali TaxID=129985 RepID=UPI002226B393|nr:hypothetical protein [Mesobacillus jeotgali]UYZ22037.1 hypothetical protein FOF60_24155 [Mesobacillus jeotgali]
MKNFNDQLQEIIDRLNPAFQHLQENEKTCTSDLISNLLGINCKRTNSVQDIINSIYFEGVTFDFFNLILSKLSISPILEKETSIGYTPYRFFNNKSEINYVPINPSKRKMAKFRKYLIEDLRMLLLKDAVLNLVANYSKKIYGDHEERLFLDYANFQERVLKLAYRLDFDENKLRGIKTTIKQYSEFIHFKAPKVSFPLMAYALCKSYDDLPIHNKRSKFYLVRGKNMALKTPGRNIYEAETVLDGAQKTFKGFSKYLNDYCSSYYPTNESLSIFLFNEVTKLLDLHMLFVDFHTRAIGQKYDDSKEAKLQLDGHFESFSKLSLIKPLGLKCYLINTLIEKNIYSDTTLWLALNNLCTIMTIYICCVIEENKLVEEHDAISMDHYLYKHLHEEEPYDIDWIINTLSIYDIDSPELKAAYFYAYKNLYKTTFQNKKINILMKIIKSFSVFLI